VHDRSGDHDRNEQVRAHGDISQGRQLRESIAKRLRSGGILALAHRGATHVRGKDCVHPDIGLVIVRMISFPARESGQRAHMAVR
jgi:hypothetical protein